MRCDSVRRPGAIFFVLVASLWVICLVAAPYAVTHTATSLRVPLPGHVAVGTYIAGSFICHQRPERSFHLWGVRMPVCARCFGLYASAPIGGAMALMLPVWFGVFNARSNGVPTRFWPSLLVASLVPMAAAACAEWIGLCHVSSLVRAATAMPLGGAVALVVGAAIQGELR